MAKVVCFIIALLRGREIFVEQGDVGERTSPLWMFHRVLKDTKMKTCKQQNHDRKRRNEIISYLPVAPQHTSLASRTKTLGFFELSTSSVPSKI
jgi:hypothetical protein